MKKIYGLAGICAVCNTVYRLGFLPFSHGYCAICYRRELEKIKEAKDV